MAEIIPFRAWRYNQYLTDKLFELTASISETKFKQKEASLYEIPFHNFHIASPMDVPPYENVHRRIQNWKLDKVILQERIPAIYPYYQRYQSPDQENPVCRKGFICMIKLEDYGKKIILPHEKTFSEAVEYRKSVLASTEMHATPTHGIYSNQGASLQKYLDESIENPLLQVLDEHQVKHTISRIQDAKIIRLFQQALADKQVIIADGHHRYESSLQYAHERKGKSLKGKEQYHLMWLTDTEMGDMGILPTHRLIHSLKNFDQTTFLNKMELFFDIERLKDATELLKRPYEKAWAFGIVFPNGTYYVKLKQGMMEKESSQWNIPSSLRDLDISILHHFIIEKVLGLPEHIHFEHLEFEQYSEKCIQRIQHGEAQMAILTHKITVSEIQRVCEEGYTMPQKATYFYPKVLSGLLFGSVAENE